MLGDANVVFWRIGIYYYYCYCFAGVYMYICVFVLLYTKLWMSMQIKASEIFKILS